MACTPGPRVSIQIHSAKTALDITAPEDFPHLRERAKAKQVEAERAAHVAHESRCGVQQRRAGESGPHAHPHPLTHSKTESVLRRIASRSNKFSARIEPYAVHGLCCWTYSLRLVLLRV